MLRLPGALVALGVLLVAFAVMRRFFTRAASFGMLLALVSLPMFVFGARLLAAGIWPIAAVSLPLMTYVLTAWGESRWERSGWGFAFGLSLLFALLAGGLPALAVVLLTLVTFAAWRRIRHALHAFVAPGFLAGFVISVLAGGWIVSQYRANVPWALEDRIALEPGRVAMELRAGKIDEIVLRDG